MQVIIHLLNDYHSTYVLFTFMFSSGIIPQGCLLRSGY